MTRPPAGSRCRAFAVGWHERMYRREPRNLALEVVEGRIRYEDQRVFLDLIEVDPSTVKLLEPGLGSGNELDLSIGGYGPWMRVRVRGTTATYLAGDMSDTRVRDQMSIKEEWSAFVGKVTALGAWDWEAVYDPPGQILDGTSWSLALEAEGRRVVSQGSNAYPSHWEEFCGAVSELVGGRPVY